MTFRLVGGDAIEAMQALAESSVDAIVTDPPYGLEFMGKEWDRLVPDDRRNKEWDGRRRDDGAEKWEPSVRDRGDGRPGGPGFSNAAHYKPNRKCLTCGLWQFDANPCRCAVPDLEYRVRAEAPTQALAMQNWHEAWATEALRILKPGGHLLAFGGTRTYHRLACAIEDAGFEIRDCLAWMYGSGFPKSLDVSKAIDKAAGAEREVVGAGRSGEREAFNGQNAGRSRDFLAGDYDVTAPATPEAQHWNGWGTALKPAFEPIVLARKPLSERNVAANVQRWGTGALNIDGCRIDSSETLARPPSTDAFAEWSVDNGGQHTHHRYGKLRPEKAEPAGRWPANVTLDETAAAMLDEQTGELTGGGFPAVNHLTRAARLTGSSRGR